MNWWLSLVGPLCGTYGVSLGLSPSVVFARAAGGVLLVFVSSTTQSEIPLSVEPGSSAILSFALPTNSIVTARYEGRGDCLPEVSQRELCVLTAPAAASQSEVSIRLDGKAIEFAYAIRLEGGALLAGSVRQTDFFVPPL